jgi:hypothetical protein
VVRLNLCFLPFRLFLLLPLLISRFRRLSRQLIESLVRNLLQEHAERKCDPQPRQQRDERPSQTISKSSRDDIAELVGQTRDTAEFRFDGSEGLENLQRLKRRDASRGDRVGDVTSDARVHDCRELCESDHPSRCAEEEIGGNDDCGAIFRLAEACLICCRDVRGGGSRRLEKRDIHSGPKPIPTPAPVMTIKPIISPWFPVYMACASHPSPTGRIMLERIIADRGWRSTLIIRMEMMTPRPYFQC